MRYALLALVLAACAPQAAPSVPGELPRTGAVLTTVNGKPVTQDMLDAFLSTLPEETRAQIVEQNQVSRVQDDLVTQEAIYQEAIARGLHQDKDVQNKLVFTQRIVLAQLLLDKVIAERTTDEAMKAWYDSHLVQFRNPQVRVAHILADTEESARAIKAQLDGGADFAATALASSTDPNTKDKGGELGWLSARELGPQLGTVLLKAEAGAVLDPVANPGGKSWHVFKVLERRDVVPFEEAKEQVGERMKKDVVESYIEEVKAKATGAAGEAKVEPPPIGAPAAPAAPAGEHGPGDGHGH